MPPTTRSKTKLFEKSDTDSDVETVEYQVSDREEVDNEQIETDDGNDEFCKGCGNEGFVICCDSCPNSFHAYCLSPPLTELPSDDDDWFCPQCQLPATDKENEKVLTWRWKRFDYPDPVEESDLLKEGETLGNIDPEREKRLYLRPPYKMEPRREREFFIKWKTYPYWKCEWIPEHAYEKWFDRSYKSYCSRHNMNKPPELEDISEHNQENDPHNLAERFYQYGVKPEWLQIHRVITHFKVNEDDYDYYVKWRELGYEQSTWEADDEDYPEFMQSIYDYWMHRELMTKAPMPKGVEVRVKYWRESQGLPSLKEVRQELAAEKEKFRFEAREKYEQQPDFITATGGNLHTYQLEGLNWLRHCWSQKIDAILADEMGLGKTIQALSFLNCLVKEGHTNGPFLIAAPLSTLINWEREAEFWAPDLHVVTYCGEKAGREIIRENEFSFFDSAVKKNGKLGKMRSDRGLKFHILLTSYEMINMDKTLLSSIKWKALIVDEAHRLKNNRSLFFRNLSEYDINYRLLLTGTPLQNNLEELFHLLSFLSPDSFVDLEGFTTEFSDISKEDQIKKLHNLLGPHMLRRMKSDVLTGMPSKSELLVRIELSPMQKAYYKNILTKNYEALSASKGTKISLQNVLMELKKCCNHPYLFDKAHEEAPKRSDGYYEGDALVKASGKFMLMQKMLRKLKEDGHRVLIFSQMTKMMDIMEDFCENEGYLYERIDGSVRGQLRQEAIDRFNAPNAKQFIFLLSTRAGGLGINLATADTVIIYDSDWNPHADIQALSRAHRLGQKNKVMIYRFVTRNSVEEKIMAVTKKKMLLTQLVVESGFGQKGPSLSKTELDDVLRFGSSELFKKETDENSIVWDDQTIEALLDRNAGDVTETETGEKKDWAGDYLSSFKIAQYVTREVQQVDDEERKDVTNQTLENSEREVSKESSAKHWQNLLHDLHEQDQQKKANQYGRGKRIRRPVKRTADKLSQLWDTTDSPNGRAGPTKAKKPKLELDKLKVEAEKPKLKIEELKVEPKKPIVGFLPPLMRYTSGHLDVLGFNYQQRKEFYSAVMLFGLSVPCLQKGKRKFQGLNNKPNRFIEAYAEMFKRHLNEPIPYQNDCFSDGVPVEVFDRDTLLSNIATITLINQKVDEFEDEHGLFPPVISGEMEVDSDQLTTSKPIQPFHFTIDDENRTKINSMWKEEEPDVNTEQSEYKVWNKRHDYYLLCGLTVHGHLQFDDIINDSRYAILSEPFNVHKSSVTVDDIKSVKSSFLLGRFKLLEKALFAEDFSKRSKARGNVDNADSVSGGLQLIASEDQKMDDVDSMIQGPAADDQDVIIDLVIQSPAVNKQDVIQLD